MADMTELADMMGDLDREERELLATLDLERGPGELPPVDSPTIRRMIEMTLPRLRPKSEARKRDVLAQLQGMSLQELLSRPGVSEESRNVPPELAQLWEERLRKYAQDTG